MSDARNLFPRAAQSGILLKAAFLAVLVALLMVPLAVVRSLVEEREGRRNAAQAEILASWGGEQTVGGPVLTIPCDRVEVDAAGKRTAYVERAHFLPEVLSIEAEIRPEKRSRGIYEAVVYTARIVLSGTFPVPDFSGWNVAAREIRWNEASLAVELPDMRAVRESASFSWAGADLPPSPGRAETGLFDGEAKAAVPAAALQGAGSPVPFRIELTLTGGGSLSFLPLGADTRVRVASPWPSPRFQGAFLPTARTVREDGFTAEWRIPALARSYSQRWTDGASETDALPATAFGVSLMTPVDTYQRVTRAVKYGVLFLVLPFLVLFLFEVFASRRAHPLQYLFVGVGDCVFYLLLLALSEHIPFAASYLVSAAACTALVTAYAQAVLSSPRRGLAMLPVLGSGYAFLYVVLQSEDYALLLGSAGLFLVLAALMILTRKVDWYAVGRKPRDTAPGAEGGGGAP